MKEMPLHFSPGKIFGLRSGRQIGEMRTDRIAGGELRGYSNLCRLVTLQQMGTVAPSPKTEDAENEGGQSRWKSWRGTAKE